MMPSDNGGDVEAGLQRVDEAGVGDRAARAVPRPSVQVLTLILQLSLFSRFESSFSSILTSLENCSSSYFSFSTTHNIVSFLQTCSVHFMF